MTESLILIGCTVFAATFNLHGDTCQTVVIFGTLSVGYNLALNYCFSQERSSKVSLMFCQKMVFKKPFFIWTKASKFRVVWTMRLCSNFTNRKWFKKQINCNCMMPLLMLMWKSETFPYIISNVFAAHAVEYELILWYEVCKIGCC